MSQNLAEYHIVLGVQRRASQHFNNMCIETFYFKGEGQGVNVN